MKNKIFKFHFFLLILLIIHSLISKLIGYGLIQAIVFALKIILCASGFVYFFMSVKPFKKIAVYFMYYFITPIIALLGYVFGGVFLVGILGSILLFPIFPKQKAFEKNDIIVYHKFQGFLGACCSYEIYQRKFVVFEKHLENIKGEGEINFDNFLWKEK
ncbi:hypothetical protein [Flavobacterium nackdongense]|uniref:Uncharacterized protein n=1 Tax=Flavobacterium nackdongense TaxID=2547394 RepID=A0A4P6YCU1_9FLAO|nr:hypothetical protein [Flavobacterium nackdongense]QBN18535.1 hypothetical protein E1750_06840 [Flavobacterium nackdongense]